MKIPSVLLRFPHHFFSKRTYFKNLTFISRSDFLCAESLTPVHLHCSKWMCLSKCLSRELCHQTAPEQEAEELSNREKGLVDRLYNGLVQGHRACLAEAITLIESTQTRKKKVAQVLLQKGYLVLLVLGNQLSLNALGKCLQKGDTKCQCWL